MSLARILRPLIVLDVPSVLRQPPKRPLDRPPMADRNESFRTLWSGCDLDLIPLIRSILIQDLAVVGAVGQDDLQPGLIKPRDPLQQADRADPVGHACGRHQDDDEQAHCIHQDVLFPARRAFPTVVAPRPAGRRRLRRLAVNRRQRWVRVAPGLLSNGLAQRVVDPPPGTVFGPLPVVMRNGWERWEVVRQIGSLAAIPVDV